MKSKILLSADDRTGSLEIGGLLASDQFKVPVGPAAQSNLCCVVDIATRHLTVSEAQARMETLLSRNAEHRAHKMDAGLRGNWAQEVEVLLQAGYKVAIICAFPDAGRRCLDGVVYIHDLPVLDSVFGQDPLNPQVSSKPAEVLEHFGVRGDVVVWDANDNAQMLAQIQRAVSEDRIVVGASGAIAMCAQQFLPPSTPRGVVLKRPLLVLCGSLNTLSRDQIQRIGQPIQTLQDTPDLSTAVAVMATPMPEGEVSNEQADSMAQQAADATRVVWAEIESLIVIGGDTAGALVGDDTLVALGCVAPGIPVSEYDGKLLVTKGGGIGQPDTVAELVSNST